MTSVKIFLWFIAIFFCPTNVFSQEFELNGVLIDKESKNRIGLAEINNKRNHYGVGSNDMGLFQIRAKIGDTLQIVKRGYNDLEVVVTVTKDLVVYLNRGIYLNTIEVMGQSKKQALNQVKQDFKNKGSFYSGKPPLLSYIFTPLTAIYETFGRTPKNARRFGNMYNTELQQTHIDQFFNKSLITQHTGLEGKPLENFMLNYRPEYEKAKNWQQYDAVKYIVDSFKKYSDTAKVQ